MNNILVLFFILLLAISCNNNNQDEQFLERSESARAESDTCVLEVKRYSNGVVSSKGRVCAGKQDGDWIAFYADGSLKWKGHFHMGNRYLPDSLDLPRSCMFVFSKDSQFRKGLGRDFRINAPPLGPNDMIVSIDQGEFEDPIDGDNFDHRVSPTDTGEICISVSYRHKSAFTICKKCFTVIP
ncbi:MAG: hypothetical protein R2817_01570 [Flavobacteriales bacterium]